MPRADLYDAARRVYYYDLVRNEDEDTSIMAWFGWKGPAGTPPLQSEQPLDSTLVVTVPGDALAMASRVTIQGYGKLRHNQQYGKVALAGLSPGLLSLFRRRAETGSATPLKRPPRRRTQRGD